METLNFIDADGGDVVEVAVGLAVGDHPIDRAIHGIPAQRV